MKSLATWLAPVPQIRQDRFRDIGLAVALAAVNVVSLLVYRSQLHPAWLALTLVALQGIPLAWRREWPVGVAVVIGVARVAYDRIGFGFAPLPLGPAIAFYTVIDRRGPAWRWAACVLVAVGITISQTAPGHNEPYDAIFQILIFAAALAAGLMSRASRVSLEGARQRAVLAEASLSRQAARSAAQERSRIARELHDVVAHHVSLMAVQAEAASAMLPGRPAQAQHSVEIIGETARQALTELRRLLGVLRGPGEPEPADTTPAASLDDLGLLIAQIQAAGLAVTMDVTGVPHPLSPSIDLTAYRIVQEALTNSLRHARSSRAVVTLCYEERYVTVTVTDPGKPGGPQPSGGGRDDPARGPAGPGFGLAGITERVASCGGILTVGPRPEGGFVLSARLPDR